MAGRVESSPSGSQVFDDCQRWLPNTVRSIHAESVFSGTSSVGVATPGGATRAWSAQYPNRSTATTVTTWRVERPRARSAAAR